MAPNRDKWVRRFIIPETTRHKKGFTIYKVTSVVFLKSSHEEISKVSVWKRYNDFKKLHSELSTLYLQSKNKESFPSLPKPKFFGRFETEVIEERRECALKFLEFIGRHSYLYRSNIFIKFFESSHADYCLNDCSQSLSSDTSTEDDRLSYTNSLPNNDISQSILQPTRINNPKNEIKCTQNVRESKEWNIKQDDTKYKGENEKTSLTKNICNNMLIEDNSEKITSMIENNQLICTKNNNCIKDRNCNVTSTDNSTVTQEACIEESADTTNIKDLSSTLTSHDGSDIPQIWPESPQYILVAAAHMNAALKHEDLMEYEEAFTQYKMGISSLSSGVESDSNKIHVDIIKEKISKYLQRAEKLYNRYLNCNISLLNKPISELQYYKVLKIINSVMLVKDVRQNCLNIVKAIEKFSSSKESISHYILRGQIPYMVRLHACIETESSIFLILQYLSRGKLWDFISSQYNYTNKQDHDNTIIKHDMVKTSKNNATVEMKDIKQKENMNLSSTNNKVQTGTDLVKIGEKYENYSDVSTTQLLEKAQILLKSVNTTLKESNSIANRLCNSHCIINENNTLALNLKNDLCPSVNNNEILIDINDISLEIQETNKNISKENIAEIDVITSNCLSQNDSKYYQRECNKTNSCSSNRCDSFNFDEMASTSSSISSLRTDNTHFTIEHDDSDKDNSITGGYTLNRSAETCNNVERNNCHISDYLQAYDTHLIVSTKVDNVDVEHELWTIPENVVCLWAAEILLALEALHQQQVIVFDLKPDNILLDDDGNIQLTYIIPHHNIDLLKYEHPYSSPELCTFSPMISLTTATDIWSFGVILYELIVGNKFQSKHPSAFQQHSIVNIPNTISENAKSLLCSVLKYEPNERMTIPEIKQHPFFKNVNWSSLINLP